MPTVTIDIQPATDATEYYPVGAVVSDTIKVDLLNPNFGTLETQYGLGPQFVFENVQEGSYMVTAWTMYEGTPDPVPASQPFISMPVQVQLRRPVPSKANVSITPDAPPSV